MPKRPIRAEDLLRVIFVGDPQISPDGERVLFTRKHINKKNKYITNLWTVDLQGKKTQWTTGEGGNGGGRWSPDGSLIAFGSGREKPSAQIHVIGAGGGEARAITNLPEGSIGEIKWSHDGSHIAFTFREQLPERTEKAKKEREQNGGSNPPLVTEDIWYRLDGDGYFGMQRFKLYVLDVAGALAEESLEPWANVKLICDKAPEGQYSFDWSPDSKELAVLHTARKRPFAETPNDQIWRYDLSGQAWQLEGLPTGSKGNVKWSPDGQWLAYAGDVDEEDPWGTRNTKVYVCSAQGGEVRDLTGHEAYDMAVGTLSDTKEAGFAAVLEWVPDSKSLYVQVGHHGQVQLGRVTLDSKVELLTEGNHSLSIGNVSNDGRRIAATFGHALKIPEVAVIESELVTGNRVPNVLTYFNQDFHEDVALVEPEEFWVESTPNKDGSPSKLHGWVMKPVGYLEPKRYPAVLQVHGGPHAQYGWAFFHEMQLLAAQGYVVVYTNPRGSKGYGEQHCAEIRGDWGNKDWEDIEVAIRWMQHQPYIHPGQMGVMGGSYGGYMTNWVVGHTKAFKAAITDRCVSNMVSMAGNSDFPFNKDGYFKGVAWGSHDKIKELWRQSPIAYFEEVDTPMLIIHSEGDLRCNIEQSEQVFTALQQQGVESRFVRYPSNTSHGMSRMGPPDLRLHRLAEIVTWWDRFLK